MALTEPRGGSDLQNMSTTALRDGDELVINGSKTWISNARHSGLIALLCKTDPNAVPRHQGISVVLVDNPRAGLALSRDLPSSATRAWKPASCPSTVAGSGGGDSGRRAGRGFAQMMKGLETGRIQVAARALGVATAALEDALAYAQHGKASAADLSTRLSATTWPTWQPSSPRRVSSPVMPRALRQRRARRHGGRHGQLFASEVAMEIALNAMRIHGGYGYSCEYDVERYFRDAPLMIIGEGTNEIQRNVITPSWWPAAI
ncbi:acyl-CoA dehydrogenase, C-terminal domain protein [Mycobacterium xenopi 4042]|uniref:Acyl-CoA dehydrogenase, C-terminal domain protein n=1 Tax=Mycobacterium xenopi 4042 TaxID=1299334 RepID=X7ZBC8_MYCXE|nr:acyl-CoA dehydrogenase, C-terminal domain protein [Mycobacterium xenopi 4042]